MATITTLVGSDGITTANSMTKINTNFDNLNTDKIETSTLDTDTTLAANSDTKIATQKATKAYIDSGGNPNASETTRGIVEEATDAEVTAGTATGATGAKLFVTPAKLATNIASLTSVGDIIKTVTVNVSSAQIQAMYATPVEIMAGPGAGKIIVIDQVYCKYNYGTVQYSNGNNVSIRGTSNTGNGFIVMGVTAMRAAANSMLLNGDAPANYVPVDNDGVEIYNDTSGYTGGDGTLTLKIRYRVITL